MSNLIKGQLDPEDRPVESNRQRSPNYPAASLDRAVETLRKLYERVKKAAVHRDAASQYLGYASEKSGSSRRALALLGHYGLVEDAGQGRIRVTEIGEGILHPKTDQERFDLLRQAATQPKIFQQLIARFSIADVHGIPADSTLKSELIRSFNFTEQAAKECIKSFRDTLNYSRFSTSGHIEEDEHSPSEPVDATVPAPDLTSARQPASRTVDDSDSECLASPLSARTRVELRVFGPIGMREARKLHSWLENVVKPWAQFLQEDTEDNGAKDAEN